MSTVDIASSELEPALADAYRTLCLLPTAPDLLVSYARMAHLVLARTVEQESVIEDAYALVHWLRRA